jgi:predicted small secreted protein
MRRSPLLLLLVLLGCLGLLAGCGTSGGEDADEGATATTAAPDDDGSDDGGTDEGTTETTEGGSDDGGSDEGSSASIEALEAILPTVEDVGPGYEVDESSADDDDDDMGDDEDDEADPMDEAFIEACPGLEQLAFLDLDSDDAGDSAMISFSDENDRELAVELDPSTEDFTEDNVDALVEAFAGCDDISLTDEDGANFTISIVAERDGSRGDFGMRFDMDVAVDFLGTPIDLQFAGHAFSVDGIAAFVSVTSGISETETTFDMVPLDEELLGDMADLMENRLNDL